MASTTARGVLRPINRTSNCPPEWTATMLEASTGRTTLGARCAFALYSLYAHRVDSRFMPLERRPEGGEPVNKFVKISVLPVAALAVACGRGKSDKDAALTADLKRDLAAASASSVELANAGDYQRTRVVSAIESPATSAPVRKRNVHKPVAHPASAGEGQVAKSPEPAVENKVEVAQPEPSTETPAPAVETPTVVAATPRPTPV